MRLKLKLADKFLLIIAVLILIPLSILFGYAYTKMSAMIKDNIFTSTEQAFDQSCSFISYKINRIYDTSNSIIINNSITDILLKNPEDYPIHEQIQDLNILRSYIYSYQHNIDISDIELYVNDDFIYSNDNLNIFPISMLNDSYWINLTAERKLHYLWAPYSYISDKDDNSIVLGKYVVNPDDYSLPIGYLFIKFNSDDLKSIICKVNSSSLGFTCIVNSNNDVISATDMNLYDEYKDIIDSVIPSNDTSLSKYDSCKDEIYVQSSYIDKTDWRIINILPYVSINNKISNQRFYLIFIVLILGTTALIVGYKFSVSITSRLSKVIDGMRAVHGNTLDNFIENDKNDELGELIDNYNFMIKRMSDLISEQYKSGQAVKNAELKALQSQINPHFLYNTLDMINWMSYKNMHSEISTAVKSLAKFYKLSLNRGDDITSISNEIDHVSLYVKIQNMRYSDRISFEIDIDDDIQQYLIPKITLQPIVENAISHGILAKGNVTGKIHISASKDNDEIKLTVCDDGIGIKKDDLPYILCKRKSETKGSGYGLNNIDQRLKLLYGDTYGLEFESIYGEGTTVTIKIPLLSKNK